jgi:hypothetical protein
MGHVLLVISFAVGLLGSVSEVESARYLPDNRIESKDSDLVRSSCKLFWNLPEPRTTSAKDIAAWAKRVRPMVSKALTFAAQAKKANKRWASFELDMVTFFGAIDLAQDSRYSFVFTQTPLVVKSLQNLSTTCASYR